MKIYIISLLLIFSTFLYGANGVVDKNTVLDFEGITTDGSVKEIGNAYKEEYGITFSPGSLVIVDSDDGGTGNFANEPEPGHTVAFFIDTSSLIMNVEKGFTNGFSFYYSTTTNAGSVVVYDGLNGTGKILKTIQLSALGSAGKGDPNGLFDTWETVGVTFDGTAKSVSFAGVANQCGFDKISFDGTPAQEIFDINFALYNKSGLDAILHTSTDPWSNTFRTIFSVDSQTVCDDYTFKVEDNNGHAARQTACNYFPYEPTTRVPAHVEIDFIINKSGNGYYFEDANLSLCKIDDNTNCNTIDAVKDFTIYGTQFSLNRDAFKFNNTTWNNATGKIKYDNFDFIEATNMIAYAANTVTGYLLYSDKEGLWNSIGYTFDKEWSVFDKKSPKIMGNGLCLGMSHVAIANYNHRDSLNSWGVGGDVKTIQWKSQIDDHWDALKGKANTPLKPLAKFTSLYEKYDIEALKKIIYYFVDQSMYSDLKNESWVGDYPDDHPWSDSNSRDIAKSILKNGSPLATGIYFPIKGGHEMVTTQYLSYNHSDKWYIYDVNDPSKYLYYKVNINTDYTVENNPIIYKENNEKYTVKYIGTDIGNDTLGIYGDALPVTSSVTARSVLKTDVAAQDNSYEYILYNHTFLHN